MTAGAPGLQHIAVEGAIGAGKTSLAMRLAAARGAELLLEEPAENPFLDRFYADMPGHAFQTQLFFLFERHAQLQALAQPSMFGNGVVSDFMFAKDALFARLTLADDELRLYQQMHDAVAAQIPEPDLVVWLQAPAELLLARVHERGIPMEQRIERDYLQRLADAYTTFFVGYTGAPVIAIDASLHNPATDEADFAALLARIDAVSGSTSTTSGDEP